MIPRVLFAGLFHETNTFIEQPTRWEHFDVTTGADVLDMSDDESPVAGFLQDAHLSGWEVVPTIDARATPGGTVENAAFESFWSEFSARARPALEAGVNAIFLVLHGAMVTASLTDVEGEFLARIRSLPGAERLPIFGVLDLHANVTERMCAHANCLITYRKNPHTDGKFTAQRAVVLMNRWHRHHKIPQMTWCRVPIVWPPSGTGTDSDPMLSLNLFAEKSESVESSIWALNVAAGFAFADTAQSGLTLSAVSEGDPQLAVEHLRLGARLAWRMRDRGIVQYVSDDVIFSELGTEPRGPVILVEPSDNIGAGAPGDGTGLLRAMLAHGVKMGLVALNDPGAVKQLRDVPIGREHRLAVGGRGWRLDAGPVELDVVLVSRSDGKFLLEDPKSHLASMSGTRFDMGPCAVVTHGGVTILLTSQRTPPFDLGQFHSQGIDVENYAVVGVKAAVAHRRAYDPIAIASHFVSTPGPCSDNLASLPYRHLQRPVYPLDAIGEPHLLVT